MYPLYNAALAFAGRPFAEVYLRARPRYRPLLARRAPIIPEKARGAVWVQACSVGEVNAARPILSALAEACPGVPRLTTTTTLSGQSHAHAVDLPGSITWFPFDFPASVKTFFDALAPRALVLIETEIWPNVMREAYRRNVPVFIVNARLSEAYLSRYRVLVRVMPAVRHAITAVGAQHETEARRFAALGISPERIEVTGNVKFDGAGPSAHAAALRETLGCTRHDRIVVFGSMRPGEEPVVRACWERLRPEYPRLKFIVAPRHLETVEGMSRALSGLPLHRHSAGTESTRAEQTVTLLDTHGELTAAYALADLCVVGGSFVKRYAGHNPIEPAALGKAVVTGPHMRSFADVMTQLSEAGAVRQESPEGTPEVLAQLMSDVGKRSAMGEAGRGLVRRNAGAAARTAALIARHLPPDSLQA